MEIELASRAKVEWESDGNMDGAHVADVIGDGAETAAYVLQEWPIACFVWIFQLLGLDEQVIEGDEAYSGCSRGVWKWVLLKGTNEVEQIEACGVEAHLAGLVSGPVAGLFGEDQVAGHIVMVV